MGLCPSFNFNNLYSVRSFSKAFSLKKFHEGETYWFTTHLLESHKTPCKSCNLNAAPTVTFHNLTIESQFGWTDAVSMGACFLYPLICNVVGSPMRFRKRSIPLLAIKPFRVDGAISGLIRLGLDKVETGYNLLMEFLNLLTKCLVVHLYALVCLQLAFICLGQLSHWYLRKSRFISKFCGNLADQPGSVVV